MQTPPAVEPTVLVATCVADGTVTYRNNAWQEVFGPDPGTWTRLSDTDQGLAAQFLKEALDGSTVTNQLFLVNLPERDDPVPTLLNFLPVRIPTVRDDESVVAITITGEVLTEPSTWMMSQTQRHRMETLGRMTMGIAHDFNNLLSGILGHTELMLRTIDEQPHELPLEEHLVTIEQAALDGASLVRKIQQYIRQETQTAFEPVDLAELIEDAVTLTKPYWYNEPRRQGIAIEAVHDLKDVSPVMGAPSELRDVFVNLILNAVQAMPRGGTIRFSTDQTPEHVVKVRVADNGTGMTDRVRARIFEPLFTTKGKRGTGMGLAVCYGTVQEHGGDVEVETQLGFGTTFTLSFPAAGAVLSPDIEETREDEVRPVRILVVDDEDMVRSVLVKLLTTKGHRVTSADSGTRALSILAENGFDIVFTDQGMPEMSGRQLAGHIRELHPDLPIVLLSGDTEVGTADETISRVVSKPFRSEGLELTIKQLLSPHNGDD